MRFREPGRARRRALSGTSAVVHERAQPDARPNALPFHGGGQAGHIGKPFVAAFPGTRGVGDGPTVVDHHEGPIPARGRQFGDQIGIALDVAGRAVPAIRVIPVIAAVNRRRSEAGLVAQRAAEAARGFERGLACAAAPRPHRGGFQRALPEANGGSSIAQVDPQRNAHRIHLPERERRTARRDAVTVSRLAVEGQKIPGQDALAEHAAPFQVAVTALPLVVEDAPPLGHLGLPAKANPHQRGFRRLNPDRQSGRRAVRLPPRYPWPSIGGRREPSGEGLGFQERRGKVRGSQDIDVSIGTPGAWPAATMGSPADSAIRLRRENPFLCTDPFSQAASDSA